MKITLNAFDRFTMSFAPKWTVARVKARTLLEMSARNYDAATRSRRTMNWFRQTGDANVVVGAAVADLRTHARDLVRNNAWAQRGLSVIANNTVGWGIVPKAVDNPEADLIWKAWANSTQCDANGQLTFSGLQRQIVRTIAQDGAALVRRRRRSPKDGLVIPVQLEILEADYLDVSKTEQNGSNYILQGVEFDGIGRRRGYWLFKEHPGSGLNDGPSRFVPASEILHIYSVDRPGQVHGTSWFASVIQALKDFSEFEDATLMRQKIAAMFAAFVEDADGASTVIGEEDDNDALETFEPGQIQYLEPGKKITFANPPTINDNAYAVQELRRAAAGLGITYEDMTGDYSLVNFSSARMGRLAHQKNIENWQFNMLIPMFCDGAWAWAMEAAVTGGALLVAPAARWTCPPMPMIEPDKEVLAATRAVRAGLITFDEMIRQQGGDPESHWTEYAENVKRLKALGIQLDSNVADVSQAGLTQVRAGGSSGDSAPPADSGRSQELTERFLEVATQALGAGE
jgi:lambda family phage portal protein